MQIFQGIQFVYTHVVQFVSSVGTWFSEIVWGDAIALMPLPFQATISACLVIVLAMSAIGLTKKLSFLLG